MFKDRRAITLFPNGFDGNGKQNIVNCFGVKIPWHCRTGFLFVQIQNFIIFFFADQAKTKKLSHDLKV